MTSFTLILLFVLLLCFINKSCDSLHLFFLFNTLFKRKKKCRVFFIKNMIHFEIYYINMIHFLMNLKYIYIINFLYLLLLILFISSCIISPFRLNNLIPHWVIVTDITNIPSIILVIDFYLITQVLSIVSPHVILLDRILIDISRDFCIKKHFVINIIFAILIYYISTC